MSEFSRRLDIHVFKDEPKSYEDFKADSQWFSDLFAHDAYDDYLKHHQPYRWHAVGMNNEIIAQGESYVDEAGCWNAIQLLTGDDTTVYAMPMYGEDRTERWMRFGATDRRAIDTSGGEDVQ